MLCLKAYNAIDLCKESVILADAYVVTGMEMGAALPDENVAGEYELTISTLGAKTLGFAVATVTSATNTFLMSEELEIDVHHCVTPSFQSY